MSKRLRSRIVFLSTVVAMVCLPLSQIGLSQSKQAPAIESASSRTPSVQISRISATAGPDGVMIEWRTAFELDNVGFNIYRIENGERIQINRTEIAGSILTLGQGRPLEGGRPYSWFDAGGTIECVYEVEDVNLNGKRSAHEVRPVASDAPQSKPGPWKTANSSLETSTSSQKELTGSGDAPATDAVNAAALQEQWTLAALPFGEVLKLAVKQTGWYRVTQPQLVAGSFVVAGRDAHNLRMFVSGCEIPIRVSRDSGALSPADYIEFYGVGLDQLTTDTQIYYLVNGSQAGLRIAPAGGLSTDRGKPSASMDSVGRPVASSRQGTAGRAGREFRNHALDASVATTAPYFSSTVQLKERIVYYSSLNNGPTENFFGQVIIGGGTKNQVLALNNVETSAGLAQVRVALQGASFHPHQTSIVVNGHLAGSLSYFGQDHVVQTYSVPVSWLLEGNNTVALSDTTFSSNLVLVDFVRISYPRNFVARSNSLLFNLRYSQGARIDGFTTPNIRILDVTDPLSVREARSVISPNGTGYSATVFAIDNVTKGERTLSAVPIAGGSLDQSALSPNQPSSWNLSSNSANLVIISHQNFVSSMAPLVTQRQSQGYTLVPASAGGAAGVINIEDVYDEFSFGVHTPQAITDFIARARAVWTTPPQYLLLIGDGSFDYRNYEGWGNFDFVPTQMIDTVFMETMSDDVMIDADNDGIAEIPIGRLPARTAAEAGLMVSKIVGFSPAAQVPTVLMVADAQAGYYFNFETASDELVGLLPQNISVVRAYRNLSGGKVALVASTSPLSGGNCAAWKASSVDFIGYNGVGSLTNCFAGTGPVPVLGNTTAAIRNGSGCDHTGNNQADFTPGSPTPRNSSSSLHLCGAPTPNVVISQIFGSGGNRLAPYSNDFVEIFNRGNASVDITNWSVQYASSSGAVWSSMRVCESAPCVLSPGQYWLVQGASAQFSISPLPQPDAVGDPPGTNPPINPRINLSAIDNAASQQFVKDAINQGVAIVNYSGHGNVDTWGSNGAFFTADDARGVSNGSHLPVLIVNDCLNGYFADPGLEGMAEAFLKNANGGSVASFSSSGETIPDGQHEMATQLYTLLYGATPVTIGDAIHQSKLATNDLDVRRTWILLGDPTLKIR